METNKHWLIEAADNGILLEKSREAGYPCLIATAYDCLRQVCEEADAYAAQLCLIDNLEMLLKFETLIAYVWAKEYLGKDFGREIFPGISMQDPTIEKWYSFAKAVTEEVKAAGRELPKLIPLQKLLEAYEKNGLVQWQKENMGTGAAGFDEEEHKNDILNRITALTSILTNIDDELRQQHICVIGKKGETILQGVKPGSQITECGNIYIRLGEEKICPEPFIGINCNGYEEDGVFFYNELVLMDAPEMRDTEPLEKYIELVINDMENARAIKDYLALGDHIRQMFILFKKVYKNTDAEKTSFVLNLMLAGLISVCEVCVEILGDNDHDTLRNQITLASLYIYMGNYADANEIWEMYIEGIRKYGTVFDNDFRRMNTLKDIACWSRTIGDAREAAVILYEWYRQREVLMGKMHPETLEALRLAADQFSDSGDHENAYYLFKGLYLRLAEKLGEDHPDTIEALHEALEEEKLNK